MRASFVKRILLLLLVWRTSEANLRAEKRLPLHSLQARTEAEWNTETGRIEKQQITARGSVIRTETVCKNKCSGHGVCQHLQKGEIVCSCSLGWAGESCSETICSLLNKCSGHGHCISPDMNVEPMLKPQKRSIIEFLDKVQKFVSRGDPMASFIDDAEDKTSLGCHCDEGYSGMDCSKVDD